MKIELKKIRVVEAFSEETTAFSADLYINGKLVGYTKNDGHGGETDVYCNGGFDSPNRKAIDDAEVWAKAQPNYNQEGFNDIPMTLDFYIDLLVDAYLKAKDEAKMKRAQLKEVQVGVPNSGTYTRYHWVGATLAQMAAKPSGRGAIQSRIDVIKRDLKAGQSILNASYLQSLGFII
jgi:hypothetical protein